MLPKFKYGKNTLENEEKYEHYPSESILLHENG